MAIRVFRYSGFYAIASAHYGIFDLGPKECGSGRFLCDPLYLAVFYTSVFHEIDKVPWVSFSFIRDLVRAFFCTNDKRI